MTDQTVDNRSPHRPCQIHARWLNFLFVISAAFILIVPSDARAISLEFETRALVIRDTSSRVAILGTAQLYPNWSPLVLHTSRVLEDADGDGIIRMDTRFDIPKRSLWIAVDVESGSIAGGAPGGRVPPRALPAFAVSSYEKESARSLSLPGGVYQIMLVRRGKGAWTLGIGDGGFSDADQALNGSVEVRAMDLAEAGTSGVAPETFADGDLLIALEPESLRWATIHLNESSKVTP